MNYLRIVVLILFSIANLISADINREVNQRVSAFNYFASGFCAAAGNICISQQYLTNILRAS